MNYEIHFIKKAEWKYLHSFRKPDFCMIQNFKPCFCTIMAIALQKKQYWKGDCCERWEKLNTQCMAKSPLNVDVFETWNKLLLLSNWEFFSLKMEKDFIHLLFPFFVLLASHFSLKSLNELPWRAFFKAIHSPGI